MQFDDTSILETTIDSKRVYDGVIVHVDLMTNRLPNGRTAPREIIRHVGASAIVPIDAEGNVFLVRQFRAPVGRALWEIPAGKLDSKEEDRLEAAKRELSEETGLFAGQWTHLTDILTTVGFCDEKISIFMAEDLCQGDVHPDEDEFLNVIKMPFEEAFQMVMRGEIRDAKTVSGILMAHNIRK